MGQYKEENDKAAELVSRIAAGDAAAEREIVMLYDRRLLVKLRQHARETHELNDLRQEVWIRVLESLRGGRVSDPRKFFGFLLGTARNVVLEDIKARKRQVVSLDDVAPLRDARKPVEHLLDDDRLAGLIHECLAQLSERDRQVIVRHYLREEPKEATCRLLGLNSLSYNNVLYRARKRLADALASLQGETDVGPAATAR